MKKSFSFNKLFPVCAIIVLTLLLANCGVTKDSAPVSIEEQSVFNQVKGDTIIIASNKTEYEIIIIEPGFNTWLASIARPEGYYSQSFLENRNMFLVQEWNQRVLQPGQYSPNLYELRIDYDTSTDYGYDVNYKLYNYFVYFQRKYKQRLSTFYPRI